MGNRTKKSISELPRQWRYADPNACGGYNYIEIDEHNTNFRPSNRQDESSLFTEILYTNQDERYIRYKRHTYYL